MLLKITWRPFRKRQGSLHVIHMPKLKINFLEILTISTILELSRQKIPNPDVYYSASQVFWLEILWKGSVPPQCVETPTKRQRNASSLRGNAPSVRGNAYETPTQWEGRVNFQRISGQNGGVIIFETHCILSWK